MKIKLYFISIIALTCSFSLLSCKDNTNRINSNYQNTIVPIYNMNNQEIGSICAFQYSMLVGNSILYTKLPESTSNSLSKLEYWLYNIDTKKDHKLGTVNDWMYEATYETIVIGDHLYMSVSVGDYIKLTNRKQIIYDVDLTNFCMTPILEIKGGIPYNSFTIVNDKLILAELLENGNTDLIEYNICEECKDAPITHIYNKDDSFFNDSIRHITANDKYIYMIRLDWDENDNYFLYMDTFDLRLNLLQTIDISNICDPLYLQMNKEDINNERKQWVADFYVHDSYIFYRNFSAITFLGSISKNDIFRLMETDNLFSIALESEPCHEDDLFLQCYGDNSNGSKRNLFYLVNSNTGEIKQAEFYADDPKYSFRSASRNTEGMILLTMGYLPLNSGIRLPERLYYLNIKDFSFTPQ